MPSYIIRRSPEHDEYIIWSTVVDAPVSYNMTREQTKTWLIEHGEVDARYGQHERAQASAEERLKRTDETGSSMMFDWDKYEVDSFWWRESPPEDYGVPHEIEDEPGTFVGRTLTRDELFDSLRL